LKYVTVWTPMPNGQRIDFIEAYNSAGEAVSGFGLGMRSSFLHRFFHTFNGFYPTGMAGPSDTRWFVEGCNVYYDSKIPYILGYESELNWMIENLEQYQSNYGTSRDGSVATTEPFSDRVLFLAYAKGSLVCMLLDRLIARVTGGAKSFDAVLREMYQRYGHFKGDYSNGDIQRITQTIAAYSLNKFFEKYVFGTSKLPLRFSRPLGIDVDWEAMAADLGPLPGQPVAITQIATTIVSRTTVSASSLITQTTRSSLTSNAPTKTSTTATETPLVTETGPAPGLLVAVGLITILLSATGFALIRYRRKAE